MSDMSLTKIITGLSPSSLFKKNVITFLIIRRHDLGKIENIRYLSLRPNANLYSLRRKVWQLLELPDYCEEKIILKDDKNVELPLTALKKGNTPQNPFILEVWPPEKRMPSSSMIHHNMLTMGQDEDTGTTILDRSPCESMSEMKSEHNFNNVIFEGQKVNQQFNYNSNNTILEGHKTNLHSNYSNKSDSNCSKTTIAMEPMAFNTQTFKRPLNTMTLADFKKSELQARISSTSLLLKLNGKKSKDNFTNVLLKIQTDLNMLSQKLCSLESRVKTPQ